MRQRTITVFGATGFLGQRIVRRLHARGFVVRIASRHPDKGRALFGIDDPRLQPIGADVRDGQSVADAVADVHGVVNAVSLYIERGTDTFHLAHVECAERVAAEAHRAGVEQLVHISGIGADLGLDPLMSGAAARANRRSGRPIQVQSWSARR